MTKITMLKTSLAATMMAFSLTAFAGGALEVNKDIMVDANPATVWKMVGNFNGLDVWHPVVVSSDLELGMNDEVGAQRLLTLGNGATITEKLVSYSDNDKSYTYQILKSPLPVSNYQSTIMVEAAGEGKSKVTWRSTFDAKDASDKDAIAAITGVYEAGLNQVSKDFAK